MFYYETKQVESNRKKGLRDADKILQAAIKKYFDENMEDIKKELKSAGVPEEEYQVHVDDLRRKVQIETIKLFKNELNKEINQLKKREQLNTPKG